MDSKKKLEKSSGIISRASRFFKGNDDRLEISKFHAGDITADGPVYLAPGSSLAGNIRAPSVVVSGYVHGLVISDSVVVENGGRVWGDIYTSQFHLEAGGKYLGWIVSLDKGTVGLLRSGSVSLDDVPAAGDRRVPDEILNERELLGDEPVMRPDQQNIIFRHLQTELAAAQLARIEIEMTFDERLAALARRLDADKFRPQQDVHPAKEPRQSDAESLHSKSVESFHSKSVESFSPGGENLPDRLELMERELGHYKLRAATCLEQLAWYKVSKAANDDALANTMKRLEDQARENERIATEWAIEKVNRAELEKEAERNAAEKLHHLRRELEEARLQITELSADLAFYKRHGSS